MGGLARRRRQISLLQQASGDLGLPLSLLELLDLVRPPGLVPLTLALVALVGQRRAVAGEMRVLHRQHLGLEVCDLFIRNLSRFSSSLLAALTGNGQGTASPQYQALTERDPQASGTNLHYQAISCMAAYKNYSLEELRLQDYQANRKTASAGPGFGQQQQQQQQQQQTTGFGATGTGFGQTTTQPPTSGFGAFSAAKPTGTGLFGQTAQPTSTGFGGFGSNTAASTGGGLFGQNVQQPSTAAFSQPQQQQQQQQPPTSFGGFGQNTQNTGTGFGTFGQNNQNKPFGGGFGAFESRQEN